MNHAAKDASRVALEKQVLQLICQDALSREMARTGLRHYRWSSPIHQAIFATASRLPASSAEETRRQLSVRLTLAGFPDVALEDYFHPHGLPRQKIPRILQRLAEFDRRD